MSGAPAVEVSMMSVPVRMGLAAHLCLQEFAWQTSKSASGNLGCLVPFSPRALFAFRTRFLTGHALHSNAKGALQLKEFRPLFPQKEGGSNPSLAGPPSAANAVNEVFSHIRKVVIDNVRDVLHVNSAGRHVRGNQYAILSALESGQRRRSLRLRTISVNHGGIDPLTIQAFRDAFRPSLGARENQATTALRFQQVEEHFGLPIVRHFEGLQTHVLRGLQCGGKREAGGIPRVMFHQLGYCPLHGRGEAQRLALFGEVSDDAAFCRFPSVPWRSHRLRRVLAELPRPAPELASRIETP